MEKQKLIEEVVRTGRKARISGGFIAVKKVYIKAQKSQKLRLKDWYTISISKKFSKSAVKRNAARRKLGPCIEKFLSEKKLEEYFIFVVLKTPFEDTSVLKNEILETLGNTIH